MIQLKRITRPSDAAPGDEYLHMAYYAKSGQGKSNGANEAHKDVDCASIYFNYPDKEADPYEIAGYEIEAETPDKHIKQGIREGMKMRYKPHPNNDIASKELKELYEVCKEATGEVIIWVDEAHLFDYSILKEIILDGRGHKVRFVIITQYPKNLVKTEDGKVISYALEAEVHFGVNEKQRSYFEFHNIDFDKMQELTEEDYACTMYSEDDGFSPSFKFPFNT